MQSPAATIVGSLVRARSVHHESARDQHTELLIGTGPLYCADPDNREVSLNGLAVRERQRQRRDTRRSLELFGLDA